MLFMGEEWGTRRPFPYFVDHTEPELADAVREGRRREFAAFGWDPSAVPDPQDPATAASAALDWDALDEPAHAEVLNWWQALLALRRTRPELTDGRLDQVDVAFDEAGGWLVMGRGTVTVAVNLGQEPAAVPVSRGTVVLASTPGFTPGGALPPDSVAVVVDHP
jgi:maltooligosyltrehalose trehalohydrolase